ncbi:MAG: hypothetical protein WAQ05_22970, partial [Rubrivivax sp.]
MSGNTTSRNDLHVDALRQLREQVGSNWSQLHSLRDKLGIKRDDPLIAHRDAAGNLTFSLDDNSGRVLEFRVLRDAASGDLAVKAFDARTGKTSVGWDDVKGSVGGGFGRSSEPGARAGEAGYNGSKHDTPGWYRKGAEGARAEDLNANLGGSLRYDNAAFQANELNIRVGKDGSGWQTEQSVVVGQVKGSVFGSLSGGAELPSFNVGIEGGLVAGSSGVRVSRFDAVEATASGLQQDSASVGADLVLGAAGKVVGKFSAEKGFSAKAEGAVGVGASVGVDVQFNKGFDLSQGPPLGSDAGGGGGGSAEDAARRAEQAQKDAEQASGQGEASHGASEQAATQAQRGA